MIRREVVYIHKMDRTYILNGKFYQINLLEGDLSEGLGVDGWTLLEWILNIYKNHL